MRFISLFILAAMNLSAIDFSSFSKKPNIAIQNSILIKVNDTTISIMDVKKKMDFLFHQHYPQLSNSDEARIQFYESSWRKVLLEMVDQELILADATDKDIQLSDGEIREEMETRFYPNVTQT